MKRLLVSFFIICFTISYADIQEPKRHAPVKFEKSVRIDGILDEAQWQNCSDLTDFIQFYPFNGAPPAFQTKVKIFYTNESVFIGAHLFDSCPDSISRELGLRDSDQSANTDLFAVHFCPYNDGVNSYEFLISASGVQTDISFTLDNEDSNWDAIWKSEISMTDSGWSAELEIPYSALRFPVKKNQTWGINFYRLIKRHNEWSTWSYLDIKNDVFWTNPGLLENLENIDPPLRLSFIPYISAYQEKNTNNPWSTLYNGGLDLKYGFNESFTLDMTLIPDFKQTQSDNVVLNLSPFEITYDEKRQFFIEGMELFSKGDLFYTRRVGDQPRNFDSIEDKLKENEQIIDNPEKTRLINSTKFSGRTQHGLGIGIFNGITETSYATVKDTLTGMRRSIVTQPLTNYNMVVLDQTLGNNSYISLLNTHMIQNNYWSDVLATEFEIKNKNNNYGIEGYAAFSNLFFKDSSSFGQRYTLEIGKIKGKYQFEYEINLETDRYNPNDMGYLQQNNTIEQQVNFELNIHEPTRLFVEQYHSLRFRYYELYLPKKFVNFRIDQSFNGTFKNYSEYNYHWAIQPQNQHDYYEARLKNRLFIRPALYHFCNNFSSPQNHRFHASAFFAINYYHSDFHNYWSYGINLEPQFRINNKAKIAYDFYWWKDNGEQGFVNQTSENLIFGERVKTEMTHTLAAKYTLNNKSNLDFRLRHYFSNADYYRFFLLRDNGYLDRYDEYRENADINYNAFNIDLVYSWNFAPGSFLNLTWKNAIYQKGDKIYSAWYENFDKTLSSPQINSISIKILYYFDYEKLHHVFKKPDGI
ncbi:MAG: hypothetical protein JXQ65_01185 [Candidatus Marinimicrobia bacterium]|nr:hypothetical protein [Candidatus Neomarinimicrobiota bacterium]